MGRDRTTNKHLPAGLYVKHGRTTDTYYTIIQRKYVGLGAERKAAEKKLRDIINGAPLSGTIAELAERFIAQLNKHLKEGSKEALAPRTVKDYTTQLREKLMPIFGHMAPNAFKPMHAAQYLARPENEDRKVRANREIAALGSMFAYGMSLGLVERNPCHGVKRNREFAREREVSIAELNRFLKTSLAEGPGYYMVALIGATVGITGRRRAEILTLKKEDLGEEHVQATEAKGRAGRKARVFEIAWSPILVEIIQQAAERRLKDGVESSYVFPTQSGTPYTEEGFSSMWQRNMKAFVKDGGEHFTAHDLRALYITNKLARGEDPNTHRDPSTMHRVYNRKKRVKVNPLA